MAKKLDLSKAEMLRRSTQRVPPPPDMVLKGGEIRARKHKLDVSKARERKIRGDVAAFRAPAPRPPQNPPTYASAPGRWQSINGAWVWQQQRADGAWENVAGY